MSNTDTTRELLRKLEASVFSDGLHDAAEDHPNTIKNRGALLAHIEAMQRDCRTCNFVAVRGGQWACNVKCTNHNQWTPVEFKQLTRSE